MQKRCLILLMSLCLLGTTMAYAANGDINVSSGAPLVLGYDSAKDYLSMMEECAQINTPNSIVMGAVYETQRNKKIEQEGQAYAPTEFFNHFDGEKILADIQEYKAPAPEQTTVLYYTENDVTMLAKVAFCEARGIKSKTEIACVMWTILNRLDSGKYGSSIASIVTAPNQFAYYRSARTVSDYGYDLKELARDVLSRWNQEKNGETEVGRVLPASYCWYTGDGRANHFRNAYRGGNRWNYSLPSPYEN